MSYFIICATALLASGLTLFSGFGLGTLLMPTFAVFFPIEVAVAATAVVHGANNIFKMFMGLIIFIFSLFELLPALQDLRFDRKFLPLGGLLSGFFGGLSGHQGALRAAFLTKAGVSPQAFVGTNAVIGFMVDLVRIAAYCVLFFSVRQSGPIGADQWPLVLSGTIAAFAGVIFGKRFLHKITMKTIQFLTGAFLLVIALALGSGLI